MSITIRLVKSPAAIAAANRLHKLIFPKDALPTDDGQVYWLASDGKGLCGFAVAAPDANDRKTFYFSRCGVLKRARGLGVQRKLIRARLAYAKRHGYTLALTDVRWYLATSLSNVIACGFRTFIPAYRWAGDKSVYMRKVIK